MKLEDSVPHSLIEELPVCKGRDRRASISQGSSRSFRSWTFLASIFRVLRGFGEGRGAAFTLCLHLPRPSTSIWVFLGHCDFRPRAPAASVFDQHFLVHQA